MYCFTQEKFKKLPLKRKLKKIRDALLSGDFSYPHLCQTVLWLQEQYPEYTPKFESLLKKDSAQERENALIMLDRELNLNPKDYEIINIPDGSRQKTEFPLYVILDNLRSAYNVGTIFRVAECLGAKKLFLCENTPLPSNPALQKAARGTEQKIEWETYKTAKDAIIFLKERHVPVFALENCPHSQDVYNFLPPFPLALVLGNEALGISKAVLALCEETLQIPLNGWKNSLNVGIAFSVCAFELYRQWRINVK